MTTIVEFATWKGTAARRQQDGGLSKGTVADVENTTGALLSERLMAAIMRDGFPLDRCRFPGSRRWLARLVLLCLASYADDDGTSARPSKHTIAREIDGDPRTVQRVLRDLVAVGLITETCREGRYCGREYAISVRAVTVRDASAPRRRHRGGG